MSKTDHKKTVTAHNEQLHSFEDDLSSKPLDEVKKESSSIIRESSKGRLRWDIYIIIAAIYNTITIPLDIAFNPVLLKSLGISILESFIDLSFFIDLFVNFRTTYISNKTGEEIYDPKLIAKRYIFGR